MEELGILATYANKHIKLSNIFIFINLYLYQYLYLPLKYWIVEALFADSQAAFLRYIIGFGF